LIICLRIRSTKNPLSWGATIDYCRPSKGRRVTGWKSIIQDIKNAGAEYFDQEVVEDGKFNFESLSRRYSGIYQSFIG